MSHSCIYMVALYMYEQLYHITTEIYVHYLIKYLQTHYTTTFNASALYVLVGEWDIIFHFFFGQKF